MFIHFLFGVVAFVIAVAGGIIALFTPPRYLQALMDREYEDMERSARYRARELRLAREAQERQYREWVDNLTPEEASFLGKQKESNQ